MYVSHIAISWLWYSHTTEWASSGASTTEQSEPGSKGKRYFIFIVVGEGSYPFAVMQSVY